MKQNKPDEHHESVKLDPVEARQGRRGAPVLMVLVVSLVVAFAVLAVLYAYFPLSSG